MIITALTLVFSMAPPVIFGCENFHQLPHFISEPGTHSSSGQRTVWYDLRFYGFRWFWFGTVLRFKNVSRADRLWCFDPCSELLLVALILSVYCFLVRGFGQNFRFLNCIENLFQPRKGNKGEEEGLVRHE